MDIRCRILASHTKKHLPRSAAAIRVLAVFPNVETDPPEFGVTKNAQDPQVSEVNRQSVNWVAGGEHNNRSPSENIRRLSSGHAASLKPRVLLGTVFAFLIVAGVLVYFLRPSNPHPASLLGSVTANAEIYPTLAPPRHLMAQKTAVQTNQKVRSSQTTIR